MTTNHSTLEQKQEFLDETFTSLECRDLQITGKEFNGCKFVGSQFAGAKFIRCKFLDCTFQNCDLSNVSLKGSTVRDVSFEDSKLLGLNWTETASVSLLKFRRCVVSMSNFSGMDLRRSTLESCIAREVELGHTNLSEANCRETDFSGSRFAQTNLTKADLRGAINYAISPPDNNIKKAKFSLPEATSLLYGLDIVLDE